MLENAGTGRGEDTNGHEQMKRRRRNAVDPDQGQVNVVRYRPTSSSSNLLQSKHKGPVPYTIVLGIVVAYISVGGWIFARLENRDYVVGVYSCFTTLATIGLGDFAPGQSLVGEANGGDNELTLIACALYLIIGLAVVAMAFTMLQRRVRRRWRQVAVRIGLRS
jgi:hypothetical protein